MQPSTQVKQLKATDVLSQPESDGILAIAALRKLEKPREIHKRFKLGKLRVLFHWGDKHSMWGRFGSGWQWALGFEFSGRTLLLNCLVFYVMISQEKGG